MLFEFVDETFIICGMMDLRLGGGAASPCLHLDSRDYLGCKSTTPPRFSISPHAVYWASQPDIGSGPRSQNLTNIEEVQQQLNLLLINLIAIVGSVCDHVRSRFRDLTNMGAHRTNKRPT